MNNTQYATPVVPPENPGPVPTVPERSTSPQIVEINRAHRHNAIFKKEYYDTDKAIKALLMLVIDKTYNCALPNIYIGYGNVTTLDMLTHMYTNYAKIIPNSL